MIEHVEEQYYQSLTDSELFSLRDSIPSFKEKYNTLENEVFEFLETLDVTAIEIGTEQISQYQTYRQCLTTLDNYNLHLNKMNKELEKAFFFF
jgi:hypothetical protein